MAFNLLHPSCTLFNRQLFLLMSRKYHTQVSCTIFLSSHWSWGQVNQGCNVNTTFPAPIPGFICLIGLHSLISTTTLNSVYISFSFLVCVTDLDTALFQKSVCLSSWVYSVSLCDSMVSVLLHHGVIHSFYNCEVFKHVEAEIHLKNNHISIIFPDWEIVVN